MKLTEHQYNELLNLSYKYFNTLGSNPVNALLLDFISKQKANQIIKFSSRVKDYWTAKKNRFELLKIKTSGSNIEKEKVDLLFFINEPTHYNQVIGILKILKKENKNFLVVTNKVAIYKELKKEKFNVNLIFSNLNVDKKTHAEFAKKIDGLITEVSLEKILNNDDFKTFSNIIKSGFVSFINYYDFFSKLLKILYPKVVIIGNDLSFFGRIFAAICKDNGINSVSIQHGTIPQDVMHKYHLVNHLFVFGEKSEEVLLDLGIEKEKIDITGAPYLDSKLYNTNTKSSDNLRKYFNLKKSDKVILVAFSGAGQRTSLKHHLKLIEAIKVLVNEFSDYKFLIKLHRKDNIEFYSDLLKTYKNVRVNPRIKTSISNDIFDWLKISEMLITGNSAVATEAMLMKKPVMTIDLMNEYPFMDFIREKITLHSKTIEEIKENFRKIYNDTHFLNSQLNKQSDFVNKYFFNPNGETSNRCSELLSNY